MQMDDTGIGIGVVLLQFNHPIAYLSMILSPKFQNSSTYIRVLNAITYAVKKWKQYLLGSQFAILNGSQNPQKLNGAGGINSRTAALSS